MANLCPLTFWCKKGMGNWGIGKNKLSITELRHLLTKDWTGIFSHLLRNHSSRPGLSANGPWDLLALAMGKSWNLRKAGSLPAIFFMFPKGAQGNHFIFKVNIRRAICEMDCPWGESLKGSILLAKIFWRVYIVRLRGHLLWEDFVSSLGLRFQLKQQRVSACCVPTTVLVTFLYVNSLNPITTPVFKRGTLNLIEQLKNLSVMADLVTTQSLLGP